MAVGGAGKEDGRKNIIIVSDQAIFSLSIASHM